MTGLKTAANRPREAPHSALRITRRVKGGAF
jgi:hypothetical protein